MLLFLQVWVLTNTLQLTKERLKTWLVGFGSDGASVNTGSSRGLATLLRQKLAPAMLAIHCFGHRANLAATSMSKVLSS